MDFSNSLMHCSTIAYFMQPGREKTPKQKWEEAVEDLQVADSKYNNLEEKKKNQAPGQKLLKKICDLKVLVAELAKNKDEDPLSKSAKGYLKRYYGYLKYGKWSASLDKGNKYTNKGKLGEPAAIELVSFLDNKLLQKNQTRFDNEFLTGEPDIIDNSGELYLYDVKTSWDIETFTENLGKDLNPLYWWQIQGYMALTGAKSGEVSYCLVNTPESILEQEKYNLWRRMDVATQENPEYKQAEILLVNNMSFDDIPPQERRLKFIVERDEEAIQAIYRRVPKCREYMAELHELHMKGVFMAKSKGEEIEPLAEEVA